jgi:3-isopropylmalate dehydrogenase
VLDADAVLVAALGEPALGGVESELDLRACVTAVVSRRAAFTLLSPLDDDSAQWTVERAFALARRSRGQLASVSHDGRWDELVGAAAADEAVEVRHLSLVEAFHVLTFEPETLDVLVSPAALSTALEEMAAGSDRRERVVAKGRLAAEGPSVFSPAYSDSSDLAGHGVADPSSMLLAAALLLREGLGEWPAAETLAAALGSTRPETTRRTLTESTRDFADAVVRMLPSSHPNAEFVREATG